MDYLTVVIISPIRQKFLTWVYWLHYTAISVIFIRTSLEHTSR